MTIPDSLAVKSALSASQALRTEAIKGRVHTNRLTSRIDLVLRISTSQLAHIHHPKALLIMSFSSLVSDLTFRDTERESRLSRTASYARSYTSTAATSVSISGDISSQLHGGYSHPLARSWQAERQLTKVH